MKRQLTEEARKDDADAVEPELEAREDEPTPEWILAELRRSEANYKKNPKSAISWEALERKLRERYGI